MSNETDEINNTGSNSKKADSAKLKVSLVVGTILAIALITFVVQNLNRTEIEFLGFNFRVRIIYLMFFSMLFGVIATYAFQMYRRNKKNKK